MQYIQSTTFVTIVSLCLFFMTAYLLRVVSRYANISGRRPLLYTALAGWIAYSIIVFTVISDDHTIDSKPTVATWGSLFGQLYLTIVFFYITHTLRRLYKAREGEAAALLELQSEKNNLETTVKIRTKHLDETIDKLEISERVAVSVIGELNEERDFAAKMQADMVSMDTPPSFCRVAKLYLPANQISGDFLRFENSGTRVRAFIGDAMGHSISSAFMTMLVSAGLESADSELPPFITLERINQMINEHRTNMYVTGILLNMEEGGGITLSNAGHPPGIIIRRNADVELIGADGGFALGMFDPDLSNYGLVNAQLDVGDKLVLYTDGISETTNTQGELLGEDGLVKYLLEQHAEAMSPAEVVASLQTLINNSNSLGKKRDDIAALVIERC